MYAAMPGTSLRGAVAIAAEGPTRQPFSLRGGRIDAANLAVDFPVDLRDHLVFPALINAHDHLQINAVPPLEHEQPFANSYAWIDAFQAHFLDPAVNDALRIPKELRLRHGALKNLLAGTTCVAHHDPWHPVLDSPGFPVALVREFGWSYALGGPDYGPEVLASFAATPATRPWMIHLAEGSDAVARAELGELDRLGCLAANSVLIHGVGLTDTDIDRVIACDASVVWCPASNLALLGCTLRPDRLAAAGRLALGSDSRVSGARDLLDELRGVAVRGELPVREALALATTAAARILRLPDRGALHAGAIADLLIVEDRGGDPAASLVGLRRAELRAVVRDGLPRIADPDFAGWFAAADIETVSVLLDGRPKLLAASLADDALFALEPGFDRVATTDQRWH